MNTQASIYIPRMSTYWSIEFINKIMIQNRIGVVNYVDFTPVNKKPGFKENFEQDVMSAFIYFSSTYYLFENIKNGTVCKIPINDNEYWICLLNKNPVPRTYMNIHQVVENGRYLENLIDLQAKKIEQLEKKIEILAENSIKILKLI